MAMLPTRLIAERKRATNLALIPCAVLETARRLALARVAALAWLGWQYSLVSVASLGSRLAPQPLGTALPAVATGTLGGYHCN